MQTYQTLSTGSSSTCGIISAVSSLESNICIEIVIRDDDGLGWYEDEKIFINARWLTEADAADEILYTFIHEYLEHILRLGHRRAEYAERRLKYFTRH